MTDRSRPTTLWGPRLRAAIALAGGLAWMAGPASVRAAAAADEAALEAELDRLAHEFGQAGSGWSVESGLEASVGHRDNIKLAPFSPQSAAFVRGAADVFALKMSDGGMDWTNMLDASATRYFSDENDKAIWFLGRSETSWPLTDTLATGLAIQLMHQDEIVDASTFENVPGPTQPVVRVQVVSPGLESKTEWTFAEDWSAVAKFGGRWNEFKDLDDFGEYFANLGAERNLGALGRVGATVQHLYRDYRTMPQASAGGREIFGTVLAITQRSGEVYYRISGGQRVDWSVKVRAAYLDSSDNGSGWYDYDRVSGIVSFSLDGGSWRLEGDVDWRRYEYAVQTAGYGIDPPAKTRRGAAVSLRAERDFGERWTAFAQAELEDSRSNDTYLAYDDHIVSVGLRWNL